MTSAEGALLGQRTAERLLANADTDPRIRVSVGLDEDALVAVERRFGFEFADDHRAFLSAVLPVGPRWPDWRSRDASALRTQLDSPVNGVLFDVEHNGTWVDAWGARPASTADVVAVARARLAAVPRLVPVWGHRYLPAGRGGSGHPVLSVHQTDIIYYGTDLVDYLFQEFNIGPGIERGDPRWQPRATVAFWQDFIE